MPLLIMLSLINFLLSDFVISKSCYYSNPINGYLTSTSSFINKKLQIYNFVNKRTFTPLA